MESFQFNEPFSTIAAPRAVWSTPAADASVAGWHNDCKYNDRLSRSSFASEKMGMR